MFSSYFNFYKKLIFVAITIAGLFLIIASGGSGSSGGGDDPTPTPNTTPPTLEITTPEDDASFKSGQFVTFVGQASDSNNKPITGANLTWHSSIDKQLGTGTQINNISLSEGKHLITFAAKDESGNSNSKTINIEVEAKNNTAPVVTIIKPADGANFHPDELIVLDGKAEDAEDKIDGLVIPDRDYQWQSSIDGLFTERAKTITVKKLSEGTHKIYLTAWDSDGLPATSAARTITVKNNPPVATITDPYDGSKHTSGDWILFQGSGTDEGQLITDASKLEWTSNKKGFIGSGQTLRVDRKSVV